MILQHGFAADGHGNWVAPGIVAAIVANGRHVLVPDARGHGRSGKPHDPSSYGHAVMARDLTALADHLGLRAFDLGGYSMGGHIALNLLQTDQRVRSAMVGGIGQSAITGEVSSDFSRSVIADAFDAYLADPQIRIENRTARGFLAFARATRADLRALAAHMRSYNPPVGSLDQVKIPVVVIAGLDDDLAKTAASLAGAIPGARFVSTPGDHLTATADPAFIAATADFFAHG